MLVKYRITQREGGASAPAEPLGRELHRGGKFKKSSAADRLRLDRCHIGWARRFLMTSRSQYRAGLMRSSKVTFIFFNVP